MGVLNQDNIDRVTIYFKNGRRVEFTDIREIAISCNFGYLTRPTYTMEMCNADCTEYTKRTSKRYKKNRKGYR